MGRFGVGWRLGVRCWSLLRGDRELLWLPVLAGVLSVLLAVVLVVPAAGLSGGAAHPGPVSWLLYLLLVVMLSFVSTFFGAALVAGALQRLAGGNPTVASSLAAAWARRGVIAQWALIAALVGSVIRLIEQRGGILGRLAGSVLGVGWAVASAFVLPVLVVEGVGPREALTRSTGMVRARWGAAAGSYAAVSVTVLPILLGGLLIGALLVAVHLAPLGVGVIVLGVIGYAVVGSALTGIARAALYQFATTGASPLLDAGLAGSAFGPRRGRRSRLG
jgi:hypothetical protein